MLTEERQNELGRLMSEAFGTFQTALAALAPLYRECVQSTMRWHVAYRRRLIRAGLAQPTRREIKAQRIAKAIARIR